MQWRPMPRRVFTVLSTLSLLLCVAVSSVATVSAERLKFNELVAPPPCGQSQWYWMKRGLMRLTTDPWPLPGATPAGAELRCMTTGSGDSVPLVETCPSENAYYVGPNRLPPSGGGVVVKGRWVFFPYSDWVVAFALLPACWAVGFLRKRISMRRREGLCPVCGYNLRATPGRCPECGGIPAVRCGTALSRLSPFRGMSAAGPAGHTPVTTNRSGDMTEPLEVGRPETLAAGVRNSLADLSTEGVDLIGLPDHRVRELVREHLDYFQMMVGPNRPAGEAAIFRAILRERRRRLQLPA